MKVARNALRRLAFIDTHGMMQHQQAPPAGGKS
jgi:hypothetical protein